MEEEEDNNIGWNRDDILRVESLNQQEGDNHLPITKENADDPTWQFYERYIHILEGDTDYDFSDFDSDELKEIDWQEIKIATQKLKGEDPEEYEETASIDMERRLSDMSYVRNFLVDNFGKDFSLPDIEEIK